MRKEKLESYNLTGSIHTLMKGSSSPETERSTQIEYAGQRRTVTINGEPNRKEYPNRVRRSEKNSNH